MSAFFDIWIGAPGNTPDNHRIENTDWEKEQVGNVELWYSRSINNDYPVLKEVNDTRYKMMVLGDFYEIIDHEELLNRCINYIEDAEVGFNDPAGHYIIFLVDIMSGNVHVFTNRFGTYHAYYNQLSSQGSLSTYYIGMAQQAVDKKLDWKGITGFIAMGFFPEDRTYLEAVKIIEPASCYSFNSSLQLTGKSRYWQWSHNVSNASLNDNLASLDQIMKASIKGAVQGKKVSIPISGGLDSRTLAGVITNLDTTVPLQGYSYGYTNTSVETAIAEKIASARNIPFEQFVVPNYLFEKKKVITDAVELFQYIDGTRQACMKEWLEKHSDMVIGGHWGDVWMDSMGIDGFEGNEHEKLLAAFRKKILKKGSEWLLKNVSEPHLPNGKAYLEQYFSDFTGKYNYIKDPDFRFKIFKTDQWSFRWTLSSIRMYQAAVLPVLPFYDKRIADLFLTIPTSMVKKRHLQIEYLKKYQPDLARITWQDYGSNLYLYKWLNNRNIIYRVFKKLQRTLFDEKPIQRNWEVFYLNDTGRKNLESILLNNPAFNKIVPAEKVNALLDEFYKNPNAANGYSVSMLLTLAQFAKVVL